MAAAAMPMAALDAAAVAPAADADDADCAAAKRPSPSAGATPPDPASRYAAVVRWAAHALARLRTWLAQLIDWAADEFDPWIKWVFLDALFALATACVARRVAAVRPLFEVFGWV
jgi:hypothetical protein